MKKKWFKKDGSTQAWKNQFNELRQSSSFKAIFFIVIVIFFTYLFIAQSLTVVQLRYQMGEMQTKLVEKENDNKILVEQIEKKTTDQYIEEIAKERLGMVKSNEVPIKVIEQEQKKMKETVIEPNEKIGIYMKDWYLELEAYIGFLKQK